jgi:hypothetical protein
VIELFCFCDQLEIKLILADFFSQCTHITSFLGTLYRITRAEITYLLGNKGLLAFSWSAPYRIYFWMAADFSRPALQGHSGVQNIGILPPRNFLSICAENKNWFKKRMEFCLGYVLQRDDTPVLIFRGGGGGIGSPLFHMLEC